MMIVLQMYFGFLIIHEANFQEYALGGIQCGVTTYLSIFKFEFNVVI